MLGFVPPERWIVVVSRGSAAIANERGDELEAGLGLDLARAGVA